ncbi:MAG TPA: hypothetical protein DDY31_14905 [Lachnospiraceae bacterium]|nr:hypothetical protein [Lachnospiraceae bacterium]
MYYKAQNIGKAIGKPIKNKILICVKIHWNFPIPHIFLTFENIEQKRLPVLSYFLTNRNYVSSTEINTGKKQILPVFISAL